MKTLDIIKTENGFRINTEKDQFKILQITDLHYFRYGLLDKIEMKKIKQLCDKFHVDIVVNTGDMFGSRGLKAIKKIMGGFDKQLGEFYPWTFAWGNHDNDIYKSDDFFSRFDAVEDYLESLPNCMYKKSRLFIENYRNLKIKDFPKENEVYIDPINGKSEWRKFDGFYGGNFLIEIPNWNLFIMDSRKRSHIPPNALIWMEDRIKEQNPQKESLVFYHVPNYEYDLIWEKKIAKGIKREPVCYEGDRGRIHEFFKKLGVIKGCFVGHDHVNDYSGIFDGIDYVYGRKTGIHGYGSRKRVPKNLKQGQKEIKIGATLITLNLTNNNLANESNFQHISVFQDGTKWKPDKMITW